MPRVSVIIPTYNRAGFLEEAIESVINQTFADWELIVVDDGSTDDTAQVVAAFGTRVRYLRQEHAGVCAARNAGIAASRGAWLSFLDSDDRMLPQNLEYLAAILEARPEVSVAYGWYYFMDEQGRPTSRGGPKLMHEPPRTLATGVMLRPCGTVLEGQILPQLLLEETMLMGTTLIRRPCVFAIGGFDSKVEFQEHWDFFLRLAEAGYAFACCREVVSFIRLHAGNRGQMLDKMLASRLAILDRFFVKGILDARLDAVRPQAYYNGFMHFALLNYRSGRPEQAARCVNEMLQRGQIQPSDLLKLRDGMSHLALSADVQRPVDFVDDLFSALHPTTQMRKLRRHVLGRVHATVALRHTRGNELEGLAYKHALKAFLYDRRLLRSRALWGLLLKRLVGHRITDWLRARWRRFSPRLSLPDDATHSTCLFISPHIDDVILSCGGTLAHLVQRQATVILVTVFTGDPSPDMALSPLAQQLHELWGDDAQPYERRRAEDQAVAEALNIEYRGLGYPEAVYRDPKLETVSALFPADYHQDMDACFDTLCQTLQQLFEEHPGALIFAPLGIGRHRDHLLVHQAVARAKEKTSVAGPLYFYEDFPYTARGRHLQVRLEELPWKATALTFDVTNTISERVRLIAMYASQIPPLFGSAEQIDERVRSYATKVGSQDRPMERFWVAAKKRWVRRSG